MRCSTGCAAIWWCLAVTAATTTATVTGTTLETVTPVTKNIQIISQQVTKSTLTSPTTKLMVSQFIQNTTSPSLTSSSPQSSSVVLLVAATSAAPKAIEESTAAAAAGISSSAAAGISAASSPGLQSLQQRNTGDTTALQVLVRGFSRGLSTLLTSLSQGTTNLSKTVTSLVRSVTGRYYQHLSNPVLLVGGLSVILLTLHSLVYEVMRGRGRHVQKRTLHVGDRDRTSLQVSTNPGLDDVIQRIRHHRRHKAASVQQQREHNLRQNFVTADQLYDH